MHSQAGYELTTRMINSATRLKNIIKENTDQLEIKLQRIVVHRQCLEKFQTLKFCFSKGPLMNVYESTKQTNINISKVDLTNSGFLIPA